MIDSIVIISTLPSWHSIETRLQGFAIWIRAYTMYRKEVNNCLNNLHHGPQEEVKKQQESSTWKYLISRLSSRSSYIYQGFSFSREGHFCSKTMQNHYADVHIQVPTVPGRNWIYPRVVRIQSPAFVFNVDRKFHVIVTIAGFYTTP